jgi:hypothetical protein
MRWALPFAVLLMVMGSNAHAQSPAAVTPAPTLTDAEMEHFLLEGQVVRQKFARKGVTSTIHATLRLGDVEHGCHITTIDEHRTSMALNSGIELDFHDSYKGYVAAYRIGRLLGIKMIPVSVVRRHDQKLAAYTWWIDGVMMDESQRLDKKIRPADVEEWNRRMYVVRVFDQLIYNFDRNLTNLLIDKNWRMWMIDHGRAFKVFKDLRFPKDLGAHCERSLLAALRRLDARALETATRDVLTSGQIEGVMARRGLIVEYYDAEIAKLGEDAVLYDLSPDVTGSTPAP